MPIRKLGYFIDIMFKPFLKQSYVKSSLDFINKYQREPEHETVTTTFDAMRLYNSISHDLDLQVIDYFLTSFLNDFLPQFDKLFVIEVADFIIKTTH